MGILDNLNLGSLAEAQQKPRAMPKAGLPMVLARKERKKTKEQQDREFREAIWARDRGRSRATGRKLVKSGTTDWAKLGEVDHAIPRSLAPDRIFDLSNGILLSKEENRLRKVVCPRAPEYRLFDYEGPDDRTMPQTFTWRDADGHITKTRIG